MSCNCYIIRLMVILKSNNNNVIDEVVAVLKRGGLVVFPTETVYGIGADATNTAAIKRLNKYKMRPLGKPYSVAVADQRMAEEYVELNETAKNLYMKFLPGPMTVVSKLKSQNSNHIQKSKLQIAPGVASEMGTLGVRIPDYQLVLEIVKKLGSPITATSANASYKKRPYKIADILDNISVKQKNLIDLVIDAGELPHREPSTVIDTTMDDPTTLRQGEIVLSAKREVLSRSEENTQNTAKELWHKYEKHAGQRAIVFALEGEMGAGKTQFTKGLARALGVTDEVVSPTFNLQLNYQLPITSSENARFASNFQSNFNNQITKSKIFSHMDAWRMQTPDELDQLGLAGIIHDKSIIAIEWADRVADTIRKYNDEAIIIWVKIRYGKKKNEREISWGVL